ncbi:hypothetical protein, partial [Klebsiella pneumoniae]|uniref:hypothetical protein n=1 Tax=Klebsiella pneumoniae TaxID=573 RepID=UPI00371643E5
MITATNSGVETSATSHEGETMLRRPSFATVASIALASVLCLSAGTAGAQDKPPLKLGAILDMSG